MFINNKYKKWYDSIITNAQTRSILSGYTEIHHIVPRSLGGSDATNNLVTLTAREHFVCHLLLTKFTVGNSRHKMIYAANGLLQWHATNQVRYVTTSRLYQAIKEQFSKTHSASIKGKTYEELYGSKKAAEMRYKKSLPRGPQSKETIKKRVEKLKGQKRTKEQLERLRQAHLNSDYIRPKESYIKAGKNISKSLTGKQKSPEHKKALSESLIGKYLGIPKSEETKQKMRKPKSEEHKKAISEGRKAKYAALREQSQNNRK